MKISSELASQTISKYVVGSLLHRIGRTKWTLKSNVHDLRIEAWGVGVWIAQAGLVSYADLADILKEEATMKAEQLPVERVSGGYLVKSHQCGDRYFVSFSKESGWQCGCLRWKCWKKEWGLNYRNY